MTTAMRLLTPVIAALLVALAPAVGAGSVAFAQPPPLVELALRGQAEEAWRQWRAMEPSPARSRAGIELAATTGDIAQGLTIYEDLIQQQGGPDHAALRHLAVASARGLTGSPDHDAQVTACAVVLQADETYQPCWDVARGVRADVANPSRQALDAYRMADAGFRPWPDLFDQVLAQLPVAGRVDLARRFTGLSAAERVALAAPGLDDADAAVRRAAALVLGDVQGPEAMTVLRRAFDATEDFGARVALAAPLARHGDLEAVQLLQRVRGTLIGPVAVEAQVALGAFGDRSAMPPQSVVLSMPGAARGRVAVALWSRAPDVAEAAVLEMLRSPMPEVRSAGLRAAGAIGLGDDQVIVARLSDPDPAVRIGAVLAVRDTVSEGPAR